ncbi:MAG: TPM domain-containing protein [Bacteroidetes bacterium]|nr:TPM domain-containing protein [Bacteroidota bacterium]
MKLILSIIFFISVTAVYPQPQFPVLTSYATDLTNTLDYEQLADLGNLLKEFEDNSGTQVAFLMVDSIGNIPIYRYTWEVANQSGLGGKEYNDGILLFIAKSDNVFRIEVAIRFEDTFNAAVQSSIIRNKIVPYFQDKKYYDGIRLGLIAITQILDNSYRPVLKDKTIIGSQSGDYEALINILLWIFLFMMFFMKRGRGLGTLFLIRALIGRKRYNYVFYRATGFLGEKDDQYGVYEGLREDGGPVRGRGAEKYFDGDMVQKKW